MPRWCRLRIAPACFAAASTPGAPGAAGRATAMLLASATDSRDAARRAAVDRIWRIGGTWSGVVDDYNTGSRGCNPTDGTAAMRPYSGLRDSR